MIYWHMSLKLDIASKKQSIGSIHTFSLGIVYDTKVVEFHFPNRQMKYGQGNLNIKKQQITYTDVELHFKSKNKILKVGKKNTIDINLECM